jgi:hypothetical protein
LIADSVYGQACQAKLTEKPTVDQVCLEALLLALDQTLFETHVLGCTEEFMNQAGEKYTPIYNTFKEAFGNARYLARDQSKDSSEIPTDFAVEQATKMEEILCETIKKYRKWITIPQNCPPEITALLEECKPVIRETVVNLKTSMGASQGPAALNRTIDELALFIVSNADAIAQKCPDVKIEKIYRALVTTASPFVLPTIAWLGPLWAFANALKNGGTPPLRKALETKLRLDAEYIISQGSPVLKPEPETDQNQLTEVQKRAAIRQEQEAKDRRDAAAKKYIDTQTDTIVEFLLQTTRGDLDIFKKRTTSNWPL